MGLIAAGDFDGVHGNAQGGEVAFEFGGEGVEVAGVDGGESAFAFGGSEGLDDFVGEARVVEFGGSDGVEEEEVVSGASDFGDGAFADGGFGGGFLDEDGDGEGAGAGGEFDEADVVGDAVQGAGFVADDGAFREEAFEAGAAGVAAAHDVQEEIGGGGGESFAAMEFDEELGHAVGSGAVLGIGEVVAHAIAGFANHGDGGSVDADAFDVEGFEAGVDGVVSTDFAEQDVGGGVVGDQEHELHQVAERERDAGGGGAGRIEERSEGAGAGVEVGFLDGDHAFELVLALIDAMEQSDRDGNLVGAGHGEVFRATEGGAASGFEVDGGSAGGAAGDGGDAGEFAFEEGEVLRGGGEGNEEKRDSDHGVLMRSNSTSRNWRRVGSPSAFRRNVAGRLARAAVRRRRAHPRGNMWEMISPCGVRETRWLARR